MRSVPFVFLFALLAVCASAVRFSVEPSSLVAASRVAPPPVGVPVPYKWCGSASDDATIDSIASNEFPPVKGDLLVLNVTGNLTKVVTSGTYTIAITVSGFPLPDITGDISAFAPLPWGLGQLNFTYSQEIPSEAPPGSYQVKISAVDQDGKQIFCIAIAFSLSAAAQPGQLTLDGGAGSVRMPPASNAQRLRPQLRVPAIKPMRAPNGRRL